MFYPLSLALLLALAGAAPTLAQTRVDPTKSTKATAAKAKPEAKPQAKPPVKPVLPEASQQQKADAERAYYGDYACEFKQTVHVGRHPNSEGYVNVAWKQQVFTMRPVLSSTGALRLEDVSGHTLVIQIPSKSMLMDVKRGIRLLDECVSPEQRAHVERTKREGDSPGSGLGIDPDKTAAAAAAAVAASTAASSAAATSRPAAASAAAP